MLRYVNDDQKIRFKINTSRKNANRLFLESVNPNVESYHEAANLLKNEYNSAVRQTRIKFHLSGLWIERFVKDEVDTAAALAVVPKEMFAMFQQVSEFYWSDPHKIEFLRKSVVGRQWAEDPLSRIATTELSFQQLYAVLEIAVQFESKKMTVGVTKKAVVLSTSTTIASIKFSGQARYAKRPEETPINYLKTETASTVNSHCTWSNNALILSILVTLQHKMYSSYLNQAHHTQFISS